MNLGEALTVRARSAQRLGDLQTRILGSATAQEGDKPAEDCNSLLERYEAVSNEHAKLVADIQLTNAMTKLSDGRTLTELLQEREALIRRRNILRATAQAASPTKGAFRFTRSEVKIIPQVEAKTLYAGVEETEELIRALDLRVQTINWTTELLTS